MPFVKLNALNNVSYKGLKRIARKIEYSIIHLKHVCACNNKNRRLRRPQYRVKAYIRAVKNRRR